MQNTLKEARHFLGIKDGVTDAELDNKILDTLKEISEKFPARQYYRLFDLKKHSVGFELSGTGLILEGDTAEKMLCDCQKIAVFAVTLGSTFDSYLRRLQAMDLSKAFIADACAGALAEKACDELQDKIKKAVKPRFITDRFSPGYGDLPLEIQKNVSDILNLSRILGIHVDETYTMNPLKSVTAFIGISDTAQGAKIRGCEYCTLKDSCTLRKGGKSCAK